MTPRHRDRRSPRIAGHAYTQPGLYFVTVCTRDRACVFGEVAGYAVALSPLGRAAHNEWARTLALRPGLVPDVFVVMPNHVHLLFGIVGGEDVLGEGDEAADVPDEAEASLSPTTTTTTRMGAGGGEGTPPVQTSSNAPGRRPEPPVRVPEPSRSVPEPSRRAEACLSQNPDQKPPPPTSPVWPGSVPAIIGGYKAAVTRVTRAAGLWAGHPLWQARFYDRIVRDDREADRIRRYIAENPARWATDRLRP